MEKKLLLDNSFYLQSPPDSLDCDEVDELSRRIGTSIDRLPHRQDTPIQSIRNTVRKTSNGLENNLGENTVSFAFMIEKFLDSITFLFWEYKNFILNLDYENLSNPEYSKLKIYLDSIQTYMDSLSSQIQKITSFSENQSLKKDYNKILQISIQELRKITNLIITISKLDIDFSLEINKSTQRISQMLKNLNNDFYRK
ncbi:hypothetical protein ACFL21_03410 [Patescibacteria group bacterium]